MLATLITATLVTFGAFFQYPVGVLGAAAPVACPAIGCGRVPPCVPAGQPNPPMTPGCPPVCPTCTGNESPSPYQSIDCRTVKINCCAGFPISPALLPCCPIPPSMCNGR